MDYKSQTGLLLKPIDINRKMRRHSAFADQKQDRVKLEVVLDEKARQIG